MTKLELEELRMALSDADRIWREARSERDAEINAVISKWQETIESYSELSRKAKTEWEDERDRVALENPVLPHPEGTVVERSKRDGGWGRQWKTVRGVIELRGIETKFPANKKWGIPMVGHVFVRLLNAKGSTGLAFDQYENMGWKPVAKEGGVE
jgi:hypothetical protein